MSWIKCKVYKTDDLFESERIVTFEIEGAVYTLITDESDVKTDSMPDENGTEGKIKVIVLQASSNRCLIDLPRDSNKGQRISVPKNYISEETVKR